MSDNTTSNFEIGIPDLSPEARDALKLLKITNIKELARSSVFLDATTLVSASNNIESLKLISETRYSTLVRKAKVAKTLLRSVPDLSIEVLEAVPVDSASVIAEKLNVSSIRELATYRPYQIAKKVLQALNPPKIIPSDSEQLSDLVPKAGDYPIEKVEYTNFVLGNPVHKSAFSLIDVDGNDFSPVDLATLPGSQSGFKSVAYGALLTFSQSWYTQGVARGQLLHSIALAPGESTRVAVIDWTRKVRGTRTEDATQGDELSSTVTQKRAIDEVINAVAQEAQKGFSKSTTQGSSQQSGKSVAFEPSGLFAQSLPSFGSSTGTASSRSNTDSESGSSGRRDIGATMLQNALNRTHQIAHDTRSRHASVIQEVSETEKETVMTRVITNYNHMHALSIQYYEVIQIYRVKMKLKSVENVIYLPVLADPDVTMSFQIAETGSLDPGLWVQTELDKASEIVGAPVLRRGKTSLCWPSGTYIRAAECAYETNHIRIQMPAILHDHEGQKFQLRETQRVPLSSIKQMTFPLEDSPASLTLTLHFDFRGIEFVIKTSSVKLQSSRKPMVIKVEFSAVAASFDISHEESTRAIMRSLNAPKISSILSRYGIKVNGTLTPLADLVDPVPAGSVGNYLAFKTTFVPNKEAWLKMIKDHGLVVGSTKETHVPLGSGGIFAEGVLGSNNCAEKLDITRFWNWKDSPPPFKPTDIAPIKTGSRAGNVDLTPGQFSNPIINITQPAALPEPTGMSGVLSAIQSAEMFRNMSGLDSTIALNQAMIQANQSGASNAGQQATQAMQNLLQAHTDRYRATTEMISSLAGSASSLFTGRGSSSDDGAKINHLMKMMKAQSGDDENGETEAEGEKKEGKKRLMLEQDGSSVVKKPKM